MIEAALIADLGGIPAPAEVEADAPGPGEVLVAVEAAALNPVDLAIAGGGFYAGHPPLPYVPGIEAVGRIGDRRVYVSGAGLGVTRNGMVRGSFAAPAEALIDIPADADAATAAALGTAGLAGWLPMTWRARAQPGETVLVLGATGFAGTVAVQAARLLGAGRVIAAGRNPDRLAALEDLADAVVALDTPDLGSALSAACGDGGAQVVFDCLCGAPLEAALEAAALDARIVQLGAAAGPAATMSSALVRGKRLSILGYSNFGVPRDVVVSAYREMLELATSGALRVDVDRVPLEQVAGAWAAVRDGGGKQVIIP
jgi:NADPH:quinone reductase-like Zn-dependent oxidoreductase